MDHQAMDMTDEEVLDRFAQVLMALSDVAAGDYKIRLPHDLPDNHPFGALARGLNEMVAALGDAQTKAREYHNDLEEKLRVISAQQEAIRELSSPVIEVWRGVLCLPVVGMVDTARSAQMTEALLRAVVEKQAQYAIIDITGIEVMDTHTADHFLRMAKAVHLLGARCVLSGINPNIAQTIVHMGVDMGGIETHRTMRSALAAFVKEMAGSRRGGA
ncbi:MAG: STAS domain-containing protein [Myxococcota bacterium]